MSYPLEGITDIPLEFVQNPRQLIGVPLAIVGAVFLSLGAQFQHRGVAKVELNTQTSGRNGLNLAQMRALFSRPSWVLGTVMLGIAIALQLGSLALSPLILVQPLGAIALVVTAILNSRISKVRMNRASIIAIAACVIGIGLFVGTAATVAGEKPVTDQKLLTILALLAVVILALGVAFFSLRHRVRAIFYIIAAGLVYGFVATLAKVIISRIQASNFDWLTVLAGIGLIVAAVVGGYFVQNAYASGPPDLVIAGLTVVDPMVAVGIGIVILEEANGAPVGAIIAFAVAGAIAVWGVLQLSRHHPQVTAEPRGEIATGAAGR